MKYFILFLTIIAFLFFSLESQAKKNKKTVKPKVTFVELGSVRRVPCRKMQPVMKSIEKKYGKQIKVIFYDVWTEKNRTKAREYNIKVIPTQVFLDEKGKEFFRHEGFYPESEIDTLLQKKGLKIVKK